MFIEEKVPGFFKYLDVLVICKCEFADEQFTCSSMQVDKKISLKNKTKQTGVIFASTLTISFKIANHSNLCKYIFLHL